METANIASDIYTVYILHLHFSQEHEDKRHLKISWVFPFDSQPYVIC